MLIRGTEEWNPTYIISVNLEKSINHSKDSFCVTGRRTQNAKTLHADLLLAGIVPLITVMVTDKLHKRQYIPCCTQDANLFCKYLFTNTHHYIHSNIFYLYFCQFPMYNTYNVIYSFVIGCN